MAASDAMSKMTSSADQLSVGVESIAQILQRMGTEMQSSLGHITLSKDVDEDAKAIAEFFVAWREVGEAAESFATRTLSLCESLRQTVATAEAERAQRVAEASRLQRAAAENLCQAAPAKSWVGWLKGESSQEEPDNAALTQLKEQRRLAMVSCLEHLAEQLEASRRMSGSIVSSTLGEARRHAKAFGEKIVVLKPSWRGEGPRRTGSTCGSHGTPGVGGVGKKVEGLMRTLATAEGRLQHKSAEDSSIVHTKKPSEKPMLAPPLTRTNGDELRIHGVYEHMVLKAGLRILDERNPRILNEFPRGLFREKLLRDLVAGNLQLQSVPQNDIAAAQRDICRLSLPQMLRLRVLHLDFTPSGCGANSVNTVGATHEAFLSALDNLLFNELGKKALEATSQELLGSNGIEAHRVGRDAVLLVAAATAATTPSHWCWWLTREHRFYFDATRFVFAREFPTNGTGVFEICDNSKRDHHDPTGQLKWMDWRLNVVLREELLSLEPLGTNRAVNASEAGKSVSAAAAGETGPSSSECSKTGTSPVKPSASAATAAMVSPDVLKGLRHSLRKTGSNLTVSDDASAATI
eukprot:TRINITY_DN30566_c0_g1_i1.p1 TRINITY_DN30566_c0_g1~~TRINITY_DN30566_c0_g1_i1.p1  ORF type:complete len:609 (+),score=64.09 TRINITY_DN30566_c0_g1_i1:93-1829(+)